MDKIHRKPENVQEDLIASSLSIKNPQFKSLAQLNKDFFKHHLQPGTEYDILISKYSIHLRALVRPKRIPCTALVTVGCRNQVISLLKWTQFVFMETGTSLLFGEMVQKLDPDISKNFLAFDDVNWKLWYRLPGARKMASSKEKMVITLEKYLQLPQNQRQDAAHIVHIIEDSQRARDISTRDIAVNLAMMYWV
ncbi:MAG: hypothetical protein Q9190_001462 [Brigantiaea leucoxantha]